MKMLVNSQQRLDESIGVITQEFSNSKYFWLNITVGKRSLDQNALSHAWYAELADQGDMTFDEYKCYCKLTFGIPILAEGDEAGFDLMLALSNLDYEQQLNLMRTVKVTSLLNRKQMTKYLDQVEVHFSQQGMRLTEKT